MIEPDFSELFDAIQRTRDVDRKLQELAGKIDTSTLRKIGIQSIDPALGPNFVAITSKAQTTPIDK